MICCLILTKNSFKISREKNPRKIQNSLKIVLLSQTFMIFGHFKASDHMHFKEKINGSVFYLVKGLKK